MVSFIVRMRFQPEDRKEITEMLQQLTLGSRRELGCISYTAHFVEGEPATVVIYEQFVDGEALDYHRTTPHFHRYAIGGLYQKMLERQVENLLAVD